MLKTSAERETSYLLPLFPGRLINVLPRRSTTLFHEYRWQNEKSVCNSCRPSSSRIKSITRLSSSFVVFHGRCAISFSSNYTYTFPWENPRRFASSVTVSSDCVFNCIPKVVRFRLPTRPKIPERNSPGGSVCFPCSSVTTNYQFRRCKLNFHVTASLASVIKSEFSRDWSPVKSTWRNGTCRKKEKEKKTGKIGEALMQRKGGKKSRHRVDRRLAREPDNEICIFMRGCCPKFREFLPAEWERGHDCARDEKPRMVILNSLGDSERGARTENQRSERLGGGGATIGGGRTIYRRFPARTRRDLLPNYFQSCSPSRCGSKRARWADAMFWMDRAA